MVLSDTYINQRFIEVFFQTMARGYSEEADRILNYLVSAYMRCFN